MSFDSIYILLNAYTTWAKRDRLKTLFTRVNWTLKPMRVCYQWTTRRFVLLCHLSAGKTWINKQIIKFKVWYPFLPDWLTPTCPPAHRMISFIDDGLGSTFWVTYTEMPCLCIVTKKKKTVSAFRANDPTRRSLSPVSIPWSDKEYFYFPLDGMLVHRRVTPSIKFAGSWE